MTTLTATTARREFFDLVKGAAEGHRTFRIQHRRGQANRAYDFVVESDPPGADVFWRSPDGEKNLGKTPLTLPLGLAEQREELFLGLTRHKAWHPFIATGLPITFQEQGETVSVSVRELRLVLRGYEPETFARDWQFASDLTQRDSTGRKTPIASRFVETVVFRKPTEPQYHLTVTLESTPGNASVYTINDNGSMGRLVGTTPLVRKMGFGLVRSSSGSVTAWIRWNETDAELWTHSGNGELYLNCFLVRDGYEPEKIQNRKLVRVAREQDQRHTASFQLTHPSKPVARFKLRMDSLPSDAVVYCVREDGSLGQQIGKTPLECEIGMAQESVEESPGKYYHKEWKVWGPDGFVRWFTERDGTAHVNLTCALYKDGFAVENITQEIFQLKPGTQYPDGTTLTIPLPTPQQAAVREQHRLQQSLVKQQRDWDEEMQRRRQEWDLELQRRQAQIAQQQQQQSGQQTIVVKQDPHYGQEWQTGMRALGEVIRPYSKVDPVTTERNIRALEGYGTLLDLMNR